ncbi:hypothetical protein PTKIN_Ptkin16aG0080200 [Pterospermum kingtungense]
MIGETLGDVEEVDLGDDRNISAGDFQIKVHLNITKPLKKSKNTIQGPRFSGGVSRSTLWYKQNSGASPAVSSFSGRSSSIRLPLRSIFVNQRISLKPNKNDNINCGTFVNPNFVDSGNPGESYPSIAGDGNYGPCVKPSMADGKKYRVPSVQNLASSTDCGLVHPTTNRSSDNHVFLDKAKHFGVLENPDILRREF